MMRLLPLGLTVVLALGACSEDGSATSETTTSTTTGELRPADEVKADRAGEGAVEGTVGRPVELAGGDLTVSVSSIDRGIRTDLGGFGSFVEVDVRVENRGEDTTNPSLAVVCAGSDEEGGSMTDSTFDMNDELPAGSFDEGTANLLLPGDDDLGGPVPSCNGPAIVRVTAAGSTTPTKVDYPIADTVLELVNADRVGG